MRFPRRKRVDEAPSEKNGVWQVPSRFNFTRDVVETAAAGPLRPALTFVDRQGIIDRRTFPQVAADANRWAALLRARGLVPGDRLLVCVGRTPAWHAAVLGALKAGLVTVPCSEMLRPHELAFRAEHSGARLVVTDRERAPAVALLGAPMDVVVVEEAAAELRGYPVDQPTHDTAADDVAFILYTSGATEDPKGAVHTHGSTWAQRLQAGHWLDARAGDLVWCTAELGWAKAIWNVLLGPWSHGAEIVIHESGFDVEQRFELLDRLGVTVLCQAPAEYRQMAVHPSLERFTLGSVRHAVSSGELLDPEVISAFRIAFGLTIHDGYGQTENTVLVANAPGAEIRPGSMGLPTPGHEVAVIDSDGNEQSAGGEGDIALLGRPPSLFREYWNAPEETSAMFRGDWYITGDRATRDEDGYLWFRGRAGDISLSTGRRISPVDVETALLEHPAVAESAVVGRLDADTGELVKAFVVLRAGVEPSEALMAELQERLRAATAPDEVPHEIEFAIELPRTPSGKIRRLELREREASGRSRNGVPETVDELARPGDEDSRQVDERAREAEARAAEILALEQAAQARAAEAAERAAEEARREEAREAARAAELVRLAAEQAASVEAELLRESELREAEAKLSTPEVASDPGADQPAGAAAAAAAKQSGRAARKAEAQRRREEERRRKEEERQRKQQEKAAAEQRKRDEAEERTAAAERVKEEERRRDLDEKRRAEAEKAAAEQERRDAEERRRAEEKAEQDRQAAEARQREAEERRRKEAERLREEAERFRNEAEEARRRAESREPAAPAASKADDTEDDHDRPNPAFVSRLHAYGSRPKPEGTDDAGSNGNAGPPAE